VFGGMRPLFSLLVLLLIATGARAHWRADRNAALMHGAAIFMLSFALVIYMNFRWGFSIVVDAFPDPAMHEVRERDYFFLIGFSLWGAWAGLGVAALWRIAAEGFAARMPRLALAGVAGRVSGHAAASVPLPVAGPSSRLGAFGPRLIAAPILVLALIPLALNWTWASRTDDWTARDWAYNVLMSVEPYGVLVTNGDNDSFPLWYIQNVERVREDVTIVLSPYLAAPWYGRQVRDISRPCPADVDPGADRTRIACQRPFIRDSVHPRLLTAWGEMPDAPEDSVLPFDDGEIDRMAGSWFVAEEDLELRFGELESTIAKGTVVSPIDTFVAAIIQSAYGERPIHFMTPSPVVARLGLNVHAVRIGLTWKLREPGTSDLVEVSGEERRTLGAYLDVALTDTLARDVFIVRGRVTDPAKPWVDHANYSIPMQYALMHYAGARGAEMRGDAAGVKWHVGRMEFWDGL
jgi:hypothetical protein